MEVTPVMKSWVGLQEFITCVELGSMVKAAEILGITKSSVSKRISKLEHRFNTKLFHRKKNSLYLTGDGELVYAKSRQIFALLNELDEVLKDHDDPEGDISISMPLGLGESMIQPVIIAFQKKYPLVTFNLNFSVRCVDIAKEGYDMSFRLASDVDEDEDVVAKRLLHRPYHLVASAEVIRRYGMPSGPEDLIKYPCLSYSEKGRQGIKDWIFKDKKKDQSISFKPNSIICSDSVDSLVRACLNGAGLLYCSEFFIIEYLQRGQLQSLLGDWLVEYNTLWLTFPSSLSLTHRARVFIDYVDEYFGNMD